MPAGGECGECDRCGKRGGTEPVTLPHTKHDLCEDCATIVKHRYASSYGGNSVSYSGP